MGGAIWAFEDPLASVMENAPFFVRLAAVLGIIVAAAMLYLAMVIASGAVDRAQLIGLVRRRRAA
jgi:putative peptidoglycan lipid II flippase